MARSRAFRSPESPLRRLRPLLTVVVVLATFAAPHVSIVLPEYDVAHVRSLIAVLGPERTNPRYLRNST